jgi:hypothetical protein
MNKRTIVRVLLVTVMVLSSAFLAIPSMLDVAKANNDTVLIKPYEWDSATEISTDTTIVLGTNWGGCRRGAVQSFLTSTKMLWKIDGEPIFGPQEEVNKYWASIEKLELAPVSEACMGKLPDHVWGTSWRYSLGTLEPGVHNLYLRWWFDHPITDVADYDGDGSPDVFSGIFYEETITLKVVE